MTDVITNFLTFILRCCMSILFHGFHLLLGVYMARILLEGHFSFSNAILKEKTETVQFHLFSYLLMVIMSAILSNMVNREMRSLQRAFFPKKKKNHHPGAGGTKGNAGPHKSKSSTGIQHRNLKGGGGGGSKVGGIRLDPSSLSVLLARKEKLLRSASDEGGDAQAQDNIDLENEPEAQDNETDNPSQSELNGSIQQRDLDNGSDPGVVSSASSIGPFVSAKDVLMQIFKSLLPNNQIEDVIANAPWRSSQDTNTQGPTDTPVVYYNDDNHALSTGNNDSDNNLFTNRVRQSEELETTRRRVDRSDRSCLNSLNTDLSPLHEITLQNKEATNHFGLI